jgi:Endodeoxyribonuclease RusA
MTVQLILTGETDIRGQARDQLPMGYEIGTGLFHAAVDVMLPMPAKWSAKKRSKMAGTSVTETGDWCKTVLAPLSGLVWSPDALVLPSLEAVWSYVDEPETWIEVTPMMTPTHRARDAALGAFSELVGVK